MECRSPRDRRHKAQVDALAHIPSTDRTARRTEETLAGEIPMKVTDVTRRLLADKREEKRLRALGYRKHETDWEIVRGHGQCDKVIVDARISADRKHVWTLIG